MRSLIFIPTDLHFAADQAQEEFAIQALQDLFEDAGDVGGDRFQSPHLTFAVPAGSSIQCPHCSSDVDSDRWNIDNTRSHNRQNGRMDSDLKEFVAFTKGD